MTRSTASPPSTKERVAALWFDPVVTAPWSGR